jgi:hypothetical protein
VETKVPTTTRVATEGTEREAAREETTKATRKMVEIVSTKEEGWPYYAQAAKAKRSTRR